MATSISTEAVSTKRANQATTASKRVSTIGIIGGLCALTLIAIAIRFPGYVERPIWHDEASTWRDVTHNDLQSMLLWKQNHSHPPLNYMLVKSVEQTIGLFPEWKLRLPGMILGVLCIPAAFLLGKRFFGVAGGFMLAGLVTFHPLMIYQSQQARMHVVHLFLTIGVLAVAFDLYKSKRMSWWRDAVLGLLLGLMIWTSHGAWVVIGGLVITWLIVIAITVKRGRNSELTATRLVQSLLIVGGIIGVSCINFLFQDKVPDAPRHSEPLSMAMFTDVFGAFLTIYPRKLITLIMALIAAAGMIVMCKKRPGQTLLITAMIGVNIIAVGALLTTHNTVGERYFVSSAVALLVAQCALCVWVSNHYGRWMGHSAYALILIMTVASIWFFEPKHSHKESEGIRASASMIQDDDLVIYIPGSRGWQALYYGIPDGPMLYQGDSYKIMPLIREGQNQGRQIWLYVVSHGLKDRDYTTYINVLDQLNQERGQPAGELPDMPSKRSTAPYVVKIESDRLQVIRMMHHLFQPIEDQLAKAD